MRARRRFDASCRAKVEQGTSRMTVATIATVVTIGSDDGSLF
jgi:hypothetical protein